MRDSAKEVLRLLKEYEDPRVNPEFDLLLQRSFPVKFLDFTTVISHSDGVTAIGYTDISVFPVMAWFDLNGEDYRILRPKPEAQGSFLKCILWTILRWCDDYGL